MRTECPRCKVSFTFHGKCPYCGQSLIKKNSSLPLILINTAVYLAIVVAAGFALYALFSAKGKSTWGSFSFKRNYEVSVKPPAIRVCGTLKPTFSNQDLKGLRDLFEKKQFDSLNKAASEIQNAFERNPSYEYKVIDFYEIFATSLPEYEALLNSWVAHSPSHFAPYLARANYYHHKGCESRGQKYASETSEQQFSAMHSFFQKALKDIATALAINPRLLNAHILSINIYNTDGENSQEDAAFNKARQYFPSCFLLYNTMAWAKLPRWGGSYAEMDKIAMQAYEHIHENPELYMLFGRIYADQAWAYQQKKQYDKAIALYTKAISYGEYYEFFEERADTYIDMKNYDLALKDINHSISLRPVKNRPYCVRATIYVLKNDPDAAMREMRSMEAMFPGDYKIREWREWAGDWFLGQGHSAFGSNLEQAVARYGIAIEMKPDYAEAYHWRGVANCKLNNTDLAYSDFVQAIKFNPHDIKSYRMLDYLLATQQRWDEIIERWNGFLSMEPNNGEGYLERAGTYKHKGDMQSALADLGTACNLGNKKACDIQKQQR